MNGNVDGSIGQFNLLGKNFICLLVFVRNLNVRVSHITFNTPVSIFDSSSPFDLQIQYKLTSILRGGQF